MINQDHVAKLIEAGLVETREVIEHCVGWAKGQASIGAFSMLAYVWRRTRNTEIVVAAVQVFAIAHALPLPFHPAECK